METRLRHSVRATAIGFIVNTGLATIKLIAGLLGHSSALVADAIESFADMGSSIIVWRGMVIAHRPADANHPYGHGKAETLAAAAVAVILLCAAALIVFQAGQEILAPHSSPEPYTLYVLLGVIVVKECLYRFVARVGNQWESAAVSADAWHHRSDAITSAAAAIGISVALIGGEGYEVADDWAAIFAAWIIAWNGFRLLRPVIPDLMDAAPAGDLLEQAAQIAREIEGVRGVEKCLARTMGYRYLVDMHLEVDGQMSVDAAHELAHTVKDAIRDRLPRVSDVTIHVEPFGHAR